MGLLNSHETFLSSSLIVTTEDIKRLFVMFLLCDQKITFQRIVTPWLTNKVEE